jgi:hypothetical protein
VRSVFGEPMRTKSPQAGFADDVVNSEQLASRNDWSPPQSCVRRTDCEPEKIEPAKAVLGSGMSGGYNSEPSRLETIGPVATTHFLGSPFRKFTSLACPANELKRRSPSLALNPD